MTLTEIIHEKCLPAKDCMLTVSDVSGETAFLYFKEGELIEANYATFWGKEALAEILNWKVDEFTVSSLPLGIKRSLWDSVDILLTPPAAGAAKQEKTNIRPVFGKSKVVAEVTPYDEYKELPGVTQIIKFEKGKPQNVFEQEGETVEPTAWMEEFMTRSKALGETLGFGKLDGFSISTDRYYLVGFQFNGTHLAVLRKHEEGVDDFEAMIKKGSG